MKNSNSEHSQLLHVEWTNKTILDTGVEHSNKKSKPPCSRFLHSCCLLGQNVYLFGGKYNYVPLKDLWKLNIVTWEWTQIETTETVLPHLQGHTMVSYKSQIFIFGGTFYETSEETPLWIYNPDLNLVRKYICDEHLPRPVGRREHTSVTHQNVMYVFGGFLDSCGSSEEFWAFDMEAEEWKQISKTKPGPRHGHVAVTHSGCMWIHGGMKNLTYLADLWIYDLALNTWKKLKGFGGNCPALSGHTANVIYDEMILVGGHRNGQLSSDAWIFNFNCHTWQCVETPKETVFPPVSLHTSVIINPIKIAQTDQEISAKSVPNLKTKMPLLSWYGEADDPRPWTSPAPSSHVHPDPSPSLDRQSIPLPDKNNNSEEDITRLVREDWEFKQSSPGDCGGANVSIQVRESSKMESNIHQGSKMFQSNSDLLKIRHSSLEDCYDDIPLLERFNSIGSDVDLGEHNTVLSLSDEKLSVKPTKEEDPYFISYFNHDFPYITKAYTMKTSSEVYGTSETSAEEFTTLFSTQTSSCIRPSASCEKRPMTSNVHSHTLSREDKENVFINPLYDMLYISDQNLISSDDARREEDFMNASCSALKYVDKSHSSELIIEDLEMCEDDLILRNVKLPSPVKPWSSLKDLSLSHCSPKYKNNHDSLCVPRQQKRSKSLSCLKNNDIEFLNFNVGLETKRCAYGKQIMKYSVDAVKKQSRYSKGISKAYLKNSNLTNRRSSGSHLIAQKPNSLTIGAKQDTYLYSHSSQPLLASESKQSKSIRKHDDYYKHFIVQSKNEPDVENKYYVERREKLSPPKTCSEVKSDQKLILLILGGQTEWQSLYTETLKIWNCYLLSRK